MNKAEELIACLEGEIAKRDEELAARRVSVENCELFRARIAELEADLRGYRDGAKAEADAGDEARAECRQLRAKLAFFTGYGHDPHPSDKLIELALINFGGKWDGDRWTIEDADLHPFVRSFAAPVSEAKAQVVVMPERQDDQYGDQDAIGWNACLDEVARLNAAPVQQVSVPAWMTSSRAFADRLYMAGWRDHADAQHSGVAGMYDELLSAAPAEPAADAPSIEMVQAACASFRMDISPMLAMHDALCAALAAHRAKGVV